MSELTFIKTAETLAERSETEHAAVALARHPQMYSAPFFSERLEQVTDLVVEAGTPAAAKIYWGILIPAIIGSGTYSGTNYLNGINIFTD